MLTVFETPYAAKGVALRGAKRAGIEDAIVEKRDDGKWYVIAPAPTADTEADHDIPAFLKKGVSPAIEPDEIPASIGAAQPAKPKSKRKPAEVGPVDQVRAFVWANPNATRKEVIAELVEKRGLSKAMVSTRLSWIRTGRDPATRDRLRAAKEAAK